MIADVCGVCPRDVWTNPHPDRSPVRVGVAGLGHMGILHARHYARMLDVELVGVMDIDRARTDRYAQELGVVALRDYRDLSERVDAVSVTVPTSSHYRACRELLDYGISILVEKPIAGTLEEADELIAQLALCGRTLQVGHIERYNPVTRAIRALGWQSQEMEFRRLQRLSPRGCDVSVIVELMVHDIDLALAFTGDDVVDVQAWGSVGRSGLIDTATAELRMSKGCRVRLIADRCSDHCERAAKMLHREGMVIADWSKHELIINERASAREQNLHFEPSDALADELRAFVSAVRSGSQPDVTASMGRNALDIAMRISQQITSSPSHG